MIIEETIRNYLDSVLDVPVFMEYPKEPPDRFVLVEKTGGGSINHLASALFALQSYGQSLYEAAVLNSELKQVMANFPSLPQISRAALNSDYNFTDTSTKEYRYQAVYDINYYEQVIERFAPDYLVALAFSEAPLEITVAKDNPSDVKLLFDEMVDMEAVNHALPESNVGMTFSELPHQLKATTGELLDSLVGLTFDEVDSTIEAVQDELSKSEVAISFDEQKYQITDRIDGVSSSNVSISWMEQLDDIESIITDVPHSTVELSYDEIETNINVSTDELYTLGLSYDEVLPTITEQMDAVPESTVDLFFDEVKADIKPSMTELVHSDVTISYDEATHQMDAEMSELAQSDVSLSFDEQRGDISSDILLGMDYHNGSYLAFENIITFKSVGDWYVNNPNVEISYVIPIYSETDSTNNPIVHIDRIIYSSAAKTLRLYISQEDFNKYIPDPETPIEIWGKEK